ncbi:hypothetical protein N7456_007106 [Penicillium angulare]|uniref:Uncharacterized protein n=1 Tax=Penicillium angulare TaxID=116970 RepID=A0A9W9KCA5_9EURO|nr:hypothetical protein N7456_007106 [Penicillium angulare]
MAQLNPSSADRARTGIPKFGKTIEPSGSSSASPVRTASPQKTGDSKKPSRPSSNQRRPSNGIQKRVRFDLVPEDTSRSIAHSNVSAQSKSKISPYARSSSLTLQSNHTSLQSRLGRRRRLLRRDAKTDDQRSNGRIRGHTSKFMKDYKSEIQDLKKEMEVIKEGLKLIKVRKPNDRNLP